METLDRKKSFFVKHQDAIWAFCLLVIPIGFWIALNGYPLVFGLALGFLNWESISAQVSFAGLENFITFFTSSSWMTALGNTLYLGLLCFAVSFVIGCLVALMLNGIKKGQGVFRTIWYLPAVASSVATSQIFNILLEYDGGVLNNMIIQAGGTPIYWQYSYGWMVFWIVFYSTWLGLGNSTLVWLAALQSQDSSVLEASRLDGCNKAQTFFYISIPQMMPLITYMIINGFIGAINIYETVLFISDGGPMGQTQVLVYKIMRAGFWDNDFGMAGAASFVMMLITVAFSALVFRQQVKTYRSEN